MAHKLVRLEGDRIVTGYELEITLKAEGFTVPIIEPVDTSGKPTRPTVQKWYFGIPVDEFNANREIWNQYNIALAAWNTAYKADLKRRDDEVFAFAVTLSELFTLVRGTYNRKTKQYDYSTATPLAYSYWQCASLLTGANRPENAIDFICYSNF